MYHPDLPVMILDVGYRGGAAYLQRKVFEFIFASQPRAALEYPWNEEVFTRGFRTMWSVTIYLKVLIDNVRDVLQDKQGSRNDGRIWNFLAQILQSCTGKTSILILNPRTSRVGVSSKSFHIISACCVQP